jgi:hypothetical protein
VQRVTAPDALAQLGGGAAAGHALGGAAGSGELPLGFRLVAVQALQLPIGVLLVLACRPCSWLLASPWLPSGCMAAHASPHALGVCTPRLAPIPLPSVWAAV